MAQVNLLDALLAHLGAAEIVRRPDTAGPLPPLWREPADGPFAPGEASGTGNDPKTILSAFVSGEIPKAPGQGYSDRITVDVHIRSKDPLAARTLERALDAELCPAPFGVRYAWVMGGLPLIESRQWRGIQRLGSDRAQGFHHIVSYLFEIPVP